FFYFQPEVGILDRNVTGVQTCALPILMTNLRKYKAYGALNLLLSSMILLLTSFPILYRYCIISASHLHPAFSYKNVEAIKFIDLFVQATWDSREYLSIVSIILLMV